MTLSSVKGSNFFLNVSFPEKFYKCFNILSYCLTTFMDSFVLAKPEGRKVFVFCESFRDYANKGRIVRELLASSVVS